MRTRKFDFEINWPLPAASFASMHFNWWLEQHHSAWIWLRFEMEMALSLSKNQIHSILSYCAHAIPLLNMENKGLKKRGAKLPLPPYYTLFSIFCQQIEMTSKEFKWMIWEKNSFPETSHTKKQCLKIVNKRRFACGFVTSAMLLFPRNRRPARSLMMKTVFFFLTFPTCF